MVCAGLVHGTSGLGFPRSRRRSSRSSSGSRLPSSSCCRTATVVIVSIVAGGVGARDTARLVAYAALHVFRCLGRDTCFHRVRPGAAHASSRLDHPRVSLGLDSIGRAQWAMLKRRPHAFAVGFGFLGGLFEGSVNISVVPLFIYFLSLDSRRVRSSRHSICASARRKPRSSVHLWLPPVCRSRCGCRRYRCAARSAGMSLAGTRIGHGSRRQPTGAGSSRLCSPWQAC